MLKYNELQKITLTDILNTAGLPPRRVEDVFLLLAEKPERVQLAFYYRACGCTYRETGKKIGVSLQRSQQYIKHNCNNIYKYLLKN